MAYDPPTNDVRERLQEVACTIASMLPAFTGFALLCFDFNLKPGQGRLEYVSNAQRPDIVRAMKEWIAKTEAGFGTHQDTGIAPTSEHCNNLANLMARLSGDNAAAARIALKAQIMCVIGDLMTAHGVPFTTETAEVLEDFAAEIRKLNPV
jgi:hypothetical protein